jgi:ABC-type multidrug transport system ATPase subunit
LQDDNMFPHLTVFETLMLAGHFFLPNSLTDEEKQEIVEATIAELGLVKARDTIIGDDNVRGVSGGERKRASIATQLLTDPAVLFLDEPTSGLDAFQSQAVMQCLSSLASPGGRLVITVIHQPRSSIFEMFDRMLVLSEGRTMFFGPAGEAVRHFAACGYPCPEAFNPSDYFLDLLSPDNRTPETEAATRNRIRALGDAWEAKHLQLAQSQTQQRTPQVGNGTQLDEADGRQEHLPSVQVIGSGANDLAAMRRNFLILCWRAWTEQRRNYGAFVAKIVFNIFFGLIIGGIYSNIGHSQESIQNRRGCLFFIMINQNFGSVTGVLNSFPKEKVIVDRERAGRAYNTLSYFVAKVLVEMPVNLIPVVVYDCIAYP